MGYEPNDKLGLYLCHKSTNNKDLSLGKLCASLFYDLGVLQFAMNASKDFNDPASKVNCGLALKHDCGCGKVPTTYRLKVDNNADIKLNFIRHITEKISITSSLAFNPF